MDGQFLAEKKFFQTDYLTFAIDEVNWCNFPNGYRIIAQNTPQMLKIKIGFTKYMNCTKPSLSDFRNRNPTSFGLFKQL